EGLSSAGASGALTPEAALSSIVAGTGLTFRFTSGSTVVIENVETTGTPGSFTMAPLVVTARRTEELLRDVPASVFVFDGEDVERSNFTDFDDSTLLTPNVDFSGNDNPGRIFVSIRGISDLNPVGTGPTIGFFQDGVLQNSTGSVININRRLVDVDRVEVIFGPQGTAFGRGTIGGAINVVTNKPTDEFEASIRSEIGSFPDFTGEAVLNLPLTDDLAVRAVAYGSLSDGFIDAPFADDVDSIGDENTGGRASIRYTPTDRLSFDASVQFDRTAVDAPSFSAEESVFDGDPISLLGTTDELATERLNVIGEAAYEFDVGRLRATTAFNRTTFIGDEDFDLSPPENSIISRDSKDTSFSQEIRFESEDFTLPSGFGTLSTNLGVIYNDISADSGTGFVTNALGEPGGNLTTNEIDVRNIGLFGDLRWRPIPPLEVTVGARLSFDRVSIDSVIAPTGSLTAFAAPSEFADEANFTSVTPSASILYDWTDAFSTYLSFSTGFRPGGFVGTLTGIPLQFDEERVRSIEGGFKSGWLDGRLAVNASAFALFYDDIQVPISATFGGGIENAASARSVGAEITAGYEPTPGLNLQAGLGFTFAKFTDFEESVSGDQTGDRLPLAPRTSLTFVGDYEYPVPLAFGLRPFARVEYSFRSDFSDDLGGFDVTNLRAGMRGEDIEVTLFVENLFGEEYVTESFIPAAIANNEPPSAFAGQASVVPGPTRRFGVIATIRF
ncbi:MAG: TonB-dependent receptor, partial [Pseudomonadota bacterium]